jgi:hypothetical protein
MNLQVCQSGPYPFDDIIEIFSRLRSSVPPQTITQDLMQRKDISDTVISIRDRMILKKSRDPVNAQEMKRAMIMDSFTVKPLKFVLKGERTPDFFALFLPACERPRQTGIYFIGRTCLDTLLGMPDLDLELFLDIIRVHELFHAFVEVQLGSEKEHTHLQAHGGSYCPFEEACANAAAYRELTRRGGDPLIEQVLFQRFPAGGLPGYGEFESITDELIGRVSEVIQSGDCGTIHDHPSKSTPAHGWNTWDEFFSGNMQSEWYYFDSLN